MSTSKPQNDPSMDDILASIRKIISDDEAKAASGPGGTSSAPPQRPTQPAPARAEGQATNPGDAKPAVTNPGDAPGSDDVLLLTNLIEELPPSLARPSSTAATQAAPRPADELPPSLARPSPPATSKVATRPTGESQPSEPPKSPTPLSSTQSPGIAPIPSPAKTGVMDINEPQPPIGSPPPRPMASPPSPPKPPAATVPPVTTPTPTPPVSATSMSASASTPPTPPSTGSKVSAAFERLKGAVVDTAPPPTIPAPTTPTVVSGKGVEDLVREMLRPLLLEWMDKNLPDMVEKLVEREIERLARR